MLKIEIRWSETGDITESEFQIKALKIGMQLFILIAIVFLILH